MSAQVDVCARDADDVFVSQPDFPAYITLHCMMHLFACIHMRVRMHCAGDLHETRREDASRMHECTSSRTARYRMELRQRRAAHGLLGNVRNASSVPPSFSDFQHYSYCVSIVTSLQSGSLSLAQQEDKMASAVASSSSQPKPGMTMQVNPRGIPRAPFVVSPIHRILPQLNHQLAARRISGHLEMYTGDCGPAVDRYRDQ